MEKGLMELVEQCATSEVWDKRIEEKAKLIEEMKELGFDKLAKKNEKEIVFCRKMNRIGEHKYFIISEDKVKKFLQDKANIYNEKEALSNPKRFTKQQKKEAAKQNKMSLADLEKALQGQIDNSMNTVESYSGYTYGNTDTATFTAALGSLGSGTSISGGWNDQLNDRIRQEQAVLRAAPQPIFGAAEVQEDISSDTKNRLKLNRFKANTMDFNLTKEGTIGQYVWQETLIKDYAGFPPRDVLDKLRVHKEKNLFDEFTIAEVMGIKDPLLLGAIYETNDRFFIAQWGEDVKLDDLI